MRTRSTCFASDSPAWAILLAASLPTFASKNMYKNFSCLIPPTTQKAGKQAQPKLQLRSRNKCDAPVIIQVPIDNRVVLIIQQAEMVLRGRNKPKSIGALTARVRS
ncbi:hypothetical protein K469DRAFT_246328 [Zopfia rhizophila CBS 207.26]|uniref:Secreted protein n=1 Tax=Zopfia rhizophila CBS 207.26 TaxID=1314779 RepID=A0A6A6DRJ1_9PEZI|nr:hypothetical protein K469DRAFT_246328 [Zopfia rhizophila CBS 207.26]